MNMFYKIIFLIFLLAPKKADDSEILKVKINLTELANRVEDRFHGFTLDFSLFTPSGLREDIKINNSRRLSKLTRGLSPALLRVGGTAANWLFFDLPPLALKSLGYTRANIIKKSEFDMLVKLARDNGNRLLFDLNAELRYGKEWNPSDAIRLLDYCVEKNYSRDIDWQLGNEPNQNSPSNLTPERVAKDYVALGKLISYYKSRGFFKDSRIVGPEVGWMGLKFIGSSAEIAGNVLDALSIHQYYFNGKNATKENYIDPKNFIKLEKLFNKIKSELNGKNHSDMSLWFTETSGAYNSGTRRVSDRFVSGFLYLDKLGFAAANKVNVVIRQTLLNGYYELCSHKDFSPNPDYWLMWVHHNLVGREVFNVTVEGHGEGPHPTIRVYAHCTKQKHGYEKGSLTLFALNVNKNKTWTLQFEESNLESLEVDEYMMTPEIEGDVLSKKVKLNGVVLDLTDSDELPPFPKPSNSTGKIQLRPLTFGFFVLQKANLTLCKGEDK